MQGLVEGVVCLAARGFLAFSRAAVRAGPEGVLAAAAVVMAASFRQSTPVKAAEGCSPAGRCLGVTGQVLDSVEGGGGLSAGVEGFAPVVRAGWVTPRLPSPVRRFLAQP